MKPRSTAYGAPISARAPPNTTPTIVPLSTTPCTYALSRDPISANAACQSARTVGAMRLSTNRSRSSDKSIQPTARRTTSSPSPIAVATSAGPPQNALPDCAHRTAGAARQSRRELARGLVVCEITLSAGELSLDCGARSPETAWTNLTSSAPSGWIRMEVRWR